MFTAFSVGLFLILCFEFENRKIIFFHTGPSVMLEILYKNYEVDKERVKCENLKEKETLCSITFNQTVRLNFSFVDKEKYTMYPQKVEGFEKVKGVWQSWAQISYLNFRAIFSREPIIDRDLPIGFGCRRVHSQNYPQVHTNYGDRFELEFSVEFKYAGRSFVGRMAASKVEYTTKTYSGKMFADQIRSMNIADAIEEWTNASLRTFYETDSHRLHQVNLNDSNCTTYDLSSPESINWHYVQDSFVKRPELYHAETNGSFLKSYSFLREHLLDGLPCLVFERKFDYWTGFSSRENETNSTRAITKRPNVNKVTANDYLVSTHFYPKNSSYWTNDGRQFSVPKRIEFAIFNDPVYGHGAIEFLTINIHSFKPNPVEQTKFNASRCIDMDKH